jgi:hypothetical protein
MGCEKMKDLPIKLHLGVTFLLVIQPKLVGKPCS